MRARAMFLVAVVMGLLCTPSNAPAQMPDVPIKMVVCEKTADGWKIIGDSSTNLAKSSG